MEKWKERLINEYKDLKSKYTKLMKSFDDEESMNYTYTSSQIGLMKEQAIAMNNYLSVLRSRIDDLALTDKITTVYKNSPDSANICRRDVIFMAYTECMRELYAKSQPSASYDEYVEKYKNGEIGKDETVFDRHYLSPDELEYIVDKYITAYGMREKWTDYCNTMIEYVEKGGPIDSYEEDENGFTHKTYKHLPPIKDILGDEAAEKVIERMKQCRDFYRFDRESSDFSCAVYLGASPTSNKDSAIKYWKEHGKDITIEDRDKETLWYRDEYGDQWEEEYKYDNDEDDYPDGETAVGFQDVTNS